MGWGYSHITKKHKGDWQHGSEHGFLMGKAVGKAVGKAECTVEYENKINEKNENNENIKKYKNSTTGRRAEFEAINLEKVNYIKSCLLIIYSLLVLWFVYVMYKNKGLQLHNKGILVSVMVAYPYIATPLLMYLYETIMYMVALMTGDIYKKSELQ